MLLQKIKRIAAIIMAVVLLITTAYFMPSHTKANELADVGTPTDATIVEDMSTETVDEISTEITTEISSETILENVTSESTTEVITDAGTEELTETSTEGTTEVATTETELPVPDVSTDTDSKDDDNIIDTLTTSVMSLNRAGEYYVDDYYWGYAGGQQGTLYSINGTQLAFCIQHSKQTAAIGTRLTLYSGASYYGNTSTYTNMLKTLYYMQYYHSTIVAEGGGMIANSLADDDAETKHDYAICAFTLSYFNGDSTGLYSSISDVQKFVDYINSKDAPLTVFEDDNAQFTSSSWTADEIVTVGTKKMIKSNPVKLNASTKLVYNFTVPSDLIVEVYNSSDELVNTFEAGEKARFRGGESFIVYADTSKGNTTTSISGIVCEQTLYDFNVYVPTDNSQSVACLGTGSPKALSFGINWEGVGTIKVHKKPSDEAMANSISCYSDLSGANFAVFNTYAEAEAATAATQNNNAVAIIVTDKNGEGSVTDLPLGTYYVKETVAPKNYELNNKVYTVVVDSPSVPTEFNAVNNFYFDPLEIVVEKVDNEGNRLEGAEFTIKYYDLQQDTDNPVDPATLGKTPLKTWVFKSDPNGQVKFRESYKISGDDLYKIDGFIGIPIGTITIQETKAPDGYVIDPTVRVQSVKNDADLSDEHYYNTSTVPNTEFKAYIKVIKNDADTQKNILNNNATFKIWSYDDNAYVSFTVKDAAGEDIEVSEFVTDDEGTLITPDILLCGTYRIDEIENPVGYYSETTEGVDITISTTANYEKHYDDNGNLITDMGTFVVDIENTSIKGYIEINKAAEHIEWNPTLGKYVSIDKPAAGIKFNIYANEDIYTPDGQGILIYSEGDLVTSITTDDDGYAKTGELYLGEYRINEEVPEGYISIQDEIVDLSLESELVEITEEGITKKLVYETVDVRNAMQQAKIKIYKTDSDKIYYLEGAKYSLYEYDEALKTKEDYINEGVLVASGVTDENGELVFDGYFPLGDYVAVETEAPKGYVTDEEIHILNAAYDDSGIEYIAVEDSYINDSIKGSINLIKRDMEDENKTLEGVKFNLYKVVNDETVAFSEEAPYLLSFNGMSADEQTKINSFKLNTEDMFIGEYVTDENGEIHIDNLCYGEYYFIETETLYRYNINETPQNFMIDENGVVYQLDVYNDGRIGTLSIWGYDAPDYGGGAKTGDNAPIMIVVVMAALSLIGIAFVFKRKKYGRN